MKLITLLFTFLCLAAQVVHAQTRPAPAPARTLSATKAKQLGKVATDAEILQRADEIRSQQRLQDYSNIAMVIADSDMKVAQRLPTLQRLSEAYMFNQSGTSGQPNNLLKSDGTPMSDQEMVAFIGKLTGAPVMTAAKSNARSNSDTRTECFVKFFFQFHGGDHNTLIVPDWIIVYPPQMGNIVECAGVTPFSSAPITIIGEN